MGYREGRGLIVDFKYCFFLGFSCLLFDILIFRIFRIVLEILDFVCFRSLKILLGFNFYGGRGKSLEIWAWWVGEKFVDIVIFELLI